MDEATSRAMQADAKAYPSLYKDLAYYETRYYRVPSASKDGWVWFRASGHIQLKHENDHHAPILDDLIRAGRDGKLFFDPQPAKPAWEQHLLGFKSEYGITS